MFKPAKAKAKAAADTAPAPRQLSPIPLKDDPTELEAALHELGALKVALAINSENLRAAEQKAGGDLRRVDPQLYANAQVLRRKIEEADKHAIAVSVRECERAYQSRKATWAELQRQRALLIAGLRACNRASAKMVLELTTLNNALPRMPGAVGPRGVQWGWQLLGQSWTEPGPQGLAANMYLREVIDAGIVTEAEVISEDAK